MLTIVMTPFQEAKTLSFLALSRNVHEHYLQLKNVMASVVVLLLSKWNQGNNTHSSLIKHDARERSFVCLMSDGGRWCHRL